VPVLRPYFGGFSNDLVSSSQLTDGNPQTLNRESQYDLEPSTRYWLSYLAAGGFGGRFRHWHFEADADPLRLESTEDGVVTGFDSLATSLDLDVFDFEALCRRHYALWVVEASLGVRYARVERHAVFALATETEQRQGADTLRFEGVGPTVALEGRRRIHGGLSGFINGRASLLAGASSNSFDLFIIDEIGPFTRSTQQETHNSLFVVETQLGLEYARPLGPFELFGRAALEVQYWFDAGGMLGTGSAGDHNDLGFAGFVLVGGFRR
jgi:hypothetical protein